MSTSVTSWQGLISGLSRKILAQIMTMAETDQAIVAHATTPSSFTMRPKLHGRDFYRAIGEPKYIVAPMVDRSEFAWRMLTRSYLTPSTSKQTLAYTPMLHARLFQDTARFRNEHFQPTRTSLESTDPPPSTALPFLDGNPTLDRPLFVQFCANKPHELLTAAQYVAPYCDAVDLNLGCPQGIARSGHYGAFLQEDRATIHSLINTLHKDLSIPVTAKMRILDTKEKTLEYAKMILSAGASILTVHGRRREQKGHNTGLADWEMIRYLRENLPADTVLFANGNILNGSDVDECIHFTGVDGVMSAEGNLSDPTIFASPPADIDSREYWRSRSDSLIGGYRLDGVFRRYMDIIYRYVLEQEPPARKPLWIPGDPDEAEAADTSVTDEEERPRKKQKRDSASIASPNIRVIQGHLFGMLKPILGVHTNIRDTLAQTKAGDFKGFEKVLSMVEKATKQGLQEETRQWQQGGEAVQDSTSKSKEDMNFSERTAAKYKRPWWVAQPYIRPLPEEAIALGALTVKGKKKGKADDVKGSEVPEPAVQRTDGTDASESSTATTNDLPKPALVCG